MFATGVLWGFWLPCVRLACVAALWLCTARIAYAVAEQRFEDLVGELLTAVTQKAQQRQTWWWNQALWDLPLAASVGKKTPLADGIERLGEVLRASSPPRLSRDDAAIRYGSERAVSLVATSLWNFVTSNSV